MTKSLTASNLRKAREGFASAAAAKKCWPCGCLHGSLGSVERAFPNGGLPLDLDAAMKAARDRPEDVQYDCLGCEVCFPAVAINALVEGVSRSRTAVP